MKIPDILITKADEITARLEKEYPQAAPLFKGCFLNTIETTVTKLQDDGYFIITGDIPAMWLRDSAWQLMQYIRYVNEDEDLKDIIKSIIARHAKFIAIDPYANAFNAVPNTSEHTNDKTNYTHELVWERKYEVDSLCSSVYLAFAYYNETLDSSIFTEDFHKMLWQIVNIFKLEQNHQKNSQYFFHRENAPATDTLPHEGKGNPVAFTGMTWSGFRPSDDRCLYNYLVPANMMAVCALKKAAQMASEGFDDTKLESECRSLAYDIDEAIKEHGVINHETFGKMYVYETDGLGNIALMDDANTPSLLSAPYLGYVKPDDEIYKNTRKFILSTSNPWYFEGKAAKGVGSPHTGTNRIWHIALCMQALTSTDDTEILDCLNTLVNTTAGTKLMHESFDKDDDTRFTRPWFAWANSLFAELVLRLLGE